MTITERVGGARSGVFGEGRFVFSFCWSSTCAVWRVWMLQACYISLFADHKSEMIS